MYRTVCTCPQVRRVTVGMLVPVSPDGVLYDFIGSVPCRRQDKHIAFQITLPRDSHKHVPATCLNLGFRTSDRNQSRDIGSTLGRGLWLQRRGGAWLDSLIFLQVGFSHSLPSWRLAWHPEKPGPVSPVPGPGPSPKSELLPPSPKPAQPAWQASVSQRCLWCPLGGGGGGQQASHPHTESQQE